MKKLELNYTRLKKLKVIDSGEGWAVAFFVCRDWSGTPELKETHGILENDQMVWASKDELRRYSFVPTVVEALTTYFEGNKMKLTKQHLKQIIKEELNIALEEVIDMNSPDIILMRKRGELSNEDIFALVGNRLMEIYHGDKVPYDVFLMDMKRKPGKFGSVSSEEFKELWQNFDSNGSEYRPEFMIDGRLIVPKRTLQEKKKKACKPAKGKRFAKRVNGKCRSFGQSGQAKSGGDRIRPGTKKGDAYCARSAKIKKCKNPPCANDLSRKKWKCRGSKSMK